MSTVALIICTSLLVVIGIFTFVFNILSIRNIIIKIEEFFDNAIVFHNKLIQGKNIDSEWIYILQNYREVTRLMSPHCYMPSTFEIVRSVRNSMHTMSITRAFSDLETEIISTISEYNKELKSIKSQWWNPFSHFFRGISTVLRIIFYYPVTLIKPDFDFKSKGWKIFSSVIGILGSIASIVSLIIQQK